jgi:chromosome segregation ATPase
MRLQEIPELGDLRSMEQALADIIEKYNQTRDNSPERSELERMIRILESEIARRERVNLSFCPLCTRPFEAGRSLGFLV